VFDQATFQVREAEDARQNSFRELASIAEARRQIDQREFVAIRNARHKGATWAQIATALGLQHRQGAQQRFTRLRDDSPSHEATPAAISAPDRAAISAEAASWAREQLLGTGPYGRSGAQSDLNEVTHELGRCWAELRHRTERAALRKPLRQDGEPLSVTGWESRAMRHALRLKQVAVRIHDLARMHRASSSGPDGKTTTPSRRGI
jgi:hypothetical protein